MCVWEEKWAIFLLLAFNSYVSTNALITKDLGGTWRVQNAERGYDLPATVPGGIYTDLMQNNIIGDIFYGCNDEYTRWVSKTNWNYSRVFAVEADLLAHENINIVFDGLDTFSRILINNVEVGVSENMFVRYIFNVKSHLQLGDNHIVIQFKSAVNVAKDLFDEQAKNYTVPPKCIPSKYRGECHVNHIRKMQASFAWDWGPAFPSVGIWKKMYLEAYNSSLIRDATIEISPNASTDCWDVQLKTYLAEPTQSKSIKGDLVVEIATDRNKIIETYKINIEKDRRGNFLTVQKLSIPKSYVQLWWPNGYGKAKLYDVQVTFTNSHDKSTKRFKIGFRTVELVQDIVNSTNQDSGRTFYFKINDIAIFAKGSNSIPVNILPELGQNKTTVRFLLQSAKDVHMNMLRVWGGGVYESDIFYELADEMGILIWQDFMFACSMYPTTDNFIRNVVNEVKHQVRRLQHHPSIVLWAGNNENEVALRQNWYGTILKFSQYKRDYIKLYVDTIRNETLLNDNTRTYLTSSPTNGIQSEQDDYIAINPQSDHYGDVHFYMYWLNSWNRNIYPINRFASEYGFQSMPSISTLLTATNSTEDLTINSPFLTSRQHHPRGYSEMQLLINYQLTLPSKNSTNFYKAFIFYSQIIQAMAVKTETEYYRQWRSHINKKGKGLTMGALYWQLNDVWAAPSWAGIDFKNNWKMLHYYAKDFFAPIIVTADLQSQRGKLDIYVVSDLMETIFSAVVTVIIYRWDSFTPVSKETIKIDILPGASQNVQSYETEKFLSPCGEDALKNCFVYFTVKHNNESIAPDNYGFPIELKHSNLQRPVLKVASVRQIDNTGKQFAIDIETNVITLFVWLEVTEVRGRFSENGFLQVTRIKTINFFADQHTSAANIQRLLSVTNVLDNEYM